MKNGMTIKEALKKERERCERLIKLLEEEREKASGYEQVTTLHAAYIAILLKKLGASEDNSLMLSKDEIKQAMEKYEARATINDKGEYGLFFAQKDEQHSAEEGRASL